MFENLIDKNDHFYDMVPRIDSRNSVRASNRSKKKTKYPDLPYLELLYEIIDMVIQPSFGRIGTGSAD